MKGFMIRGLSGLALVALAIMEFSTPRAAQAIDQKPVEPKSAVQKPVDQKPGPPAARRSLQFQELEDPVEPLDPQRQRKVSDEKRLDALASSRGRILLIARFRSLAAYEQARQRPDGDSCYRVLIRLAVDMRIDDDQG